ncbi:unnamed protein product [Protopolystoma xenopodis]|uniref:Uncharacterized protein n=1 Tax=Protopolystoma xenopodis TaxID=117903 RepID=A0A3S5AE02_9PLAT|nr:unnamed protein product [Protopolystoma xenopodis]
MPRLTDDSDYDAGEASGNHPRPRFDSGNYHGYYGLRTRSNAFAFPFACILPLVQLEEAREWLTVSSIRRKPDLSFDPASAHSLRPKRTIQPHKPLGIIFAFFRLLAVSAAYVCIDPGKQPLKCPVGAHIILARPFRLVASRLVQLEGQGLHVVRAQAVGMAEQAWLVAWLTGLPSCSLAKANQIDTSTAVQICWLRLFDERCTRYGGWALHPN